MVDEDIIITIITMYCQNCVSIQFTYTLISLISDCWFRSLEQTFFSAQYFQCYAYIRNFRIEDDKIFKRRLTVCRRFFCSPRKAGREARVVPIGPWRRSGGVGAGARSSKSLEQEGEKLLLNYSCSTEYMISISQEATYISPFKHVVFHLAIP